MLEVDRDDSPPGDGAGAGRRRRVTLPPQDVHVWRGERGAGGEGGAGRGLLAHAPGRRRRRTPAEAIVVGGDNDGLRGDDGDGESPSRDADECLNASHQTNFS